MTKTRIAVILIAAVIMAVTIHTGLVLATTSTGSSTLVGRGTYDEFKIKREMPGLELDLKARTDVDIATQIITFKSGTDSGWHKHPGPVFISVVSGTMTFYDSDDSDCSPVVVTAGHGFVDLGLHAHIARNESGLPATNVVTYFVPVGAPLRIDQTHPSNCPSFTTRP
jgi:archaellin